MKRLLLLAALGAALAWAPARAQDFATAVSTAELTNNGAIDVDFGCTAGYDAAFVWFNFPTQEILAYNPEAPSGSRTSVVATAAELDALTPGTDVNRCRAAASDPVGGDFTFFALANSTDGVDFLALADENGVSLVIGPDGSADGIGGLAVSPDDEALYVARSQFFGAPEDGVYRLDGSTLTEVVTNADLSLTDIAAAADGTLYALSDQFAEGEYQNVIVQVEDPSGSADLSTFADPFALFTGTADLTDIEVGFVGGTELMFVANNSFSGDDGEEVARYTLDGDGVLFFSESDVLADPDVTSGDWAIPGGPNNLMLDPLDEVLFLTNTDRFGGADELLVADDLFPVAVEDGPAGGGAALTAWPNPAAGRLRVGLTVARTQPVRVALYDVLGREVAVLHDGTVAAGAALTLDASLAPLPAGVYVVRAAGETVALTRTVTVAR